MTAMDRNGYLMQLVRFGMVGCLAVAVQYAVYWLILPVASHNIAYTIGYLVSFLVNYLLTTAFTFKTEKSYSNGIGFAVCHVINYFLQIALLNLFIYMGCDKVYAPIPVYAICVPTNFLLVRWVMQRGKADQPKARSHVNKWGNAAGKPQVAGQPKVAGQPQVAVFDFDGTLTRQDTLLAFIRFTCGSRRFFQGFLLYAPMLVLMKLRLYSNAKAKEKVFGYFFRGWRYADFQEQGRRFAAVVERIKRDDVVALLKQHIEQGHDVLVVSASIEEWVRPWCEQQGVSRVIGTRVEVDGGGLLTGRFSSSNCYGAEKVNRLQEVLPSRCDYYLYAYGDSRGDRELFAYADEYVKL